MQTKWHDFELKKKLVKVKFLIDGVMTHVF
jgi:hypothetical protein